MNFDKALEFVKKEYRKNIDVFSDSFLDGLLGVTEILDSMGYSMDYQLTALFRNLLRDTEAKPEDILRYSSMEVLEAVKLLEKPMKCEMYKYLYIVKHNMLAQPVKLAEYLYKLRSIQNPAGTAAGDLIRSIEEYVLECAEGTPFYEPIFKELLNVKEAAFKG